MQDEKALFEAYWEEFRTRLKGKMIGKAEKGQLHYPMLKLLLDDACADWESEYTVCGRWLQSYCAQNPAKGDLVRRILLEDMHFEEIEEKTDYSNMVNYLVPLAGAAAGLGLSSIYHANTLIKTVSTVAPAVLLYSPAKQIGSTMKESYKTDRIEQYLEQLEKYKQSALMVLVG